MKVVEEFDKLLTCEQPQRSVDFASHEATAGTRFTQQLLDDLLGRLEDDDSLAFLPNSYTS